jgi:hypothetical protein
MAVARKAIPIIQPSDSKLRQNKYLTQSQKGRENIPAFFMSVCSGWNRVQPTCQNAGCSALGFSRTLEYLSIEWIELVDGRGRI